MSRPYKYLGIAGALLLPAGAVALTIPNLFSNGDVLTASALNENFAAIEGELNQLRTDVTALQAALDAKASGDDITQLNSAVSSLQSSLNQKASTASVTALQTDVATLSSSALTDCSLHWTDCAPTDVACFATCPAGKFAIAGSCHAAGGKFLNSDFPNPPGAWPTSGESFTKFDRTHCRGTAAGDILSSFVVCCAEGI